MTQSGAKSPSQSGHVSDDNEGVNHISQRSSISWASPSDFPVLYKGHSLVEVLTLCRDAVDVFYSPNRMGHKTLVGESLFSLQRCSRCILQPKLTGPQDTLSGEYFLPTGLLLHSCEWTLVILNIGQTMIWEEIGIYSQENVHTIETLLVDKNTGLRNTE